MGKKNKHKAKSKGKAKASARTPLSRNDAGTRVEVAEYSRFAAVQPNRLLHRTSWGLANGQSINNDLVANLRILQAGCQFEYASSPIFEGVCNTYKKDVVGRDGPRLQVRSKNKEFNRVVQQAWKKVFTDPDPSHRFTGVESLGTRVLDLLLAGSFINIYTTVKRPNTPLTFGWRSVHPRRLGTPPEFVGDNDVAFGMRIDPETTATTIYYIAELARYGQYVTQTFNYQPIPAAAVQHVFNPVEDDQLTGYPMMSSTLEAAADLREYDKIVMEAAKNSAGHAVGLEATNPDWILDPDPIGTDTLPYSAAEINVAPPGYKFAFGTATQPASQYVPYRRERGAELGRPIHMPLLVVFLTAAEANFSSAQWEGMVYGDGIDCLQGMFDRRMLNPAVEQLIIELAMRGMVKVPDEYELSWSWNVPSHANFEKFISALEKAVAIGAIAISDASALLGYNWDEVQDAREKAKDDNEKRDLPQPPSKDDSTIIADESVGADGNPLKTPGGKQRPTKRRVKRTKKREHARFSLN